MKEADLQRQIQLRASEIGVRLFRNHRGQVEDVHGRHHTFGLCNGASDLIGWTAEGKFLAIEVKLLGGRPTKEQARFIEAVLQAGGRAGVAWSAADLERILAGQSGPCPRK